MRSRRARETYGEAPPVRGYAWTWPSAGRDAPDARSLETGGPQFVGSYGSWAEAARALGHALPAPVDPARVAAAKAALKRLERAHASVSNEIAEAADADALRTKANALAAFLPRVPKGASGVELPDPSDPARTLEITLDPKLKPHGTSSPVQRAGKLERVAAQARPARGDRPPDRPRAPRSKLPRRAASATARRARASAPVAESKRRASLPHWTAAIAAPKAEVVIGKSSLGIDHLTHQLARSEAYWMHVHGRRAVVLRRGRGEAPAGHARGGRGWAAFYPGAERSTVPVTVTQKKYVSSHRGARAGPRAALGRCSPGRPSRPTRPGQRRYLKLTRSRLPLTHERARLRFAARRRCTAASRLPKATRSSSSRAKTRAARA
jgi:hypothetical protein